MVLEESRRSDADRGERDQFGSEVSGTCHPDDISNKLQHISLKSLLQTSENKNLLSVDRSRGSRQAEFGTAKTEFDTQHSTQSSSELHRLLWKKTGLITCKYKYHRVIMMLVVGTMLQVHANDTRRPELAPGHVMYRPLSHR